MKVHNVLVNTESGNVKIIDFGLSRFIGDDNVEAEFCETSDGHSVQEYVMNMLGAGQSTRPNATQVSRLVAATENMLSESPMWKHLKLKRMAHLRRDPRCCD